MSVNRFSLLINDPDQGAFDLCFQFLKNHYGSKLYIVFAYNYRMFFFLLFQTEPEAPMLKCT